MPVTLQVISLTTLSSQSLDVAITLSCCENMSCLFAMRDFSFCSVLVLTKSMIFVLLDDEYDFCSSWLNCMQITFCSFPDTLLSYAMLSFRSLKSLTMSRRGGRRINLKTSMESNPRVSSRVSGRTSCSFCLLFSQVSLVFFFSLWVSKTCLRLVIEHYYCRVLLKEAKGKWRIFFMCLNHRSVDSSLDQRRIRERSEKDQRRIRERSDWNLHA